MNAQDIHNILGAQGWRNVLLAAGLSEQELTNKHGPCPACGGKDRFRFDNKQGRGNFYCNQCGSGDGFRLLMLAKGVDFAEARRTAMSLAGIMDDARPAATPISRPTTQADPAKPTGRVVAILRESCRVEDCDEARAYLTARGLWPLPEGHCLRAHPSVEYWDDRERIGRFPALVAPVRDKRGELVTLHVTYLEPAGATKLKGYEPRKLLSGMTGREGCAVQILPPKDGVLGIAEGIETAISAGILHGANVWAALNATLMAKFTPPPDVKVLAVFADRDVAGLEAASRLMQSLQGSARLSIHTPPDGDWNDFLMSKLEAA